MYVSKKCPIVKYNVAMPQRENEIKTEAVN